MNNSMDNELLPAKLVTYGFADILPATDERLKVLKEQRLERGFDDTETWSLYSTVCKFMVPRLKAFKEVHAGCPSSLQSNEEWRDIIQSMIDALELVGNDDIFIMSAEQEKIYTCGMDNFKNYFRNLWW